MENTEQAETEKILALPNRKFVFTLTTLTFIASIIGLVFSVMYVVFWGNLDIVLSKGDQNASDLREMLIKVVGEQRWGKFVQEGTLNSFFFSMRNHYYLVALSNLLAMVGAFMMRSYKRNGFFIYVLSHVLFTVSPFIMIMSYEINWMETILFLAISIAFIFLYSKNLKFFH